MFTNCPQLAELMLSKLSSFKICRYTCQWLDNVNMHFNAKLNRNIPCDSRVISILLTDHGRTESHSADSIVVQDYRTDPSDV